MPDFPAQGQNKNTNDRGANGKGGNDKGANSKAANAGNSDPSSTTPPDVSSSISMLISRFIGSAKDTPLSVPSPSDVSPLAVLRDKKNDQEFDDLLNTLEQERPGKPAHQIALDIEPDKEAIINEIGPLHQQDQTQPDLQNTLMSLLPAGSPGHASLSEPGLSLDMERPSALDTHPTDQTFGDIAATLRDYGREFVTDQVKTTILARMDVSRETTIDALQPAVKEVLKAGSQSFAQVAGGVDAAPLTGSTDRDLTNEVSTRIVFKVSQSLYDGLDRDSNVAIGFISANAVVRTALARALDAAVTDLENRLTAKLNDRLHIMNGDTTPQNDAQHPGITPAPPPTQNLPAIRVDSLRGLHDYVYDVIDAGVHVMAEQSGLIDVSFTSTKITSTNTDTTQDKTQARALFELTLQHFIRDNDAAKARAGFLAAIQADPTYAAPRYNLAMLAEANENWDDAIKWLQEYRRLDGVSQTSVRAQLEIERLNVVRDLDKTPEGKLKRRYDDAIARARRLMAIGMAKDAVREAGAAVQITPARWEAYAMTGAALAAQGEFDMAAGMLQKGLERAETDRKPSLKAVLDECKIESHYKAIGLAGTAALEGGDYKRAAALFEEGWQLFPARDAYGLAAALARAGSGDLPKAKEYLDKLSQSKDPETVRKAHQMLAKIAARQTGQPPATKRP